MDLSKSKSPASRKTVTTEVERLEELPENAEQSIYKLLFETRKTEGTKK